MKSRFFFLALVFVSLLLLSSCRSNGNNPYTENYYVGTRGVEIAFVGDSPPRQMYEGESFPVSIFVSNEGAYTLTSDKPAIVTYSFDNFYFREIARLYSGQELVLLGKSYNWPMGELQVLPLAYFNVRDILGQRESPESDFFVSICYPYQTLLVDQVCIDASEFRNDVRSKVCTSQDKLYSAGQGGPIAVTKIEPTMQTYGPGLDIRPSFLITVSNVGSGSVLAPQALDGKSCTANQSDWNKVRISAHLADFDLRCVPEVIDMRMDKGMSRCYMDSGSYSGPVNYLANIRVQLDYSYISSISQTVDIEKLYYEPLSSSDDLADCESWQSLFNGRCVDSCSQRHREGGWSCDCEVGECIKSSLSQEVISRIKNDLVNVDKYASTSCDYVSSLALCEPGKFCCKKEDSQDGEQS